MSGNTAVKDYSVGQKVIHWLLAIFLLIDLTVAQQFGGEMAPADRLQNREGHAVVGTIIITLFMIRIILRIRNGSPAFPGSMPGWQKAAALGTHWGFYVVIAITICTGLITAFNATAPINWLGQFDLAILANTSDDQFRFVRQFHEFATKALIALLLMHVGAAFYHLIFARDGRFERMLRFWRQEST